MGVKMSRSKNKRNTTRDLIGIKGFTEYGLSTNKGELLLFTVAPTNISVLSQANVSIKIHHLMMVLSSIPDIEISCTDSSERFDDNKQYLHERLAEETNPNISKLLSKDIEFLDRMQLEISTARQFMFVVRCKNIKREQVFQTANRVEKIISEQGFEVHRMSKDDIKRFIAIIFKTSMNGEKIPDVDGEQYFELDE